jgi:hypothetical protein
MKCSVGYRITERFLCPTEYRVARFIVLHPIGSAFDLEDS